MKCGLKEMKWNMNNEIHVHREWFSALVITVTWSSYGEFGKLFTGLIPLNTVLMFDGFLNPVSAFIIRRF